MSRDMAMPIKGGLFALWRYDSFPYVVGGTVTKLYPSGRVETEEYGPGHVFQPILILPEKDGKEILEKLDQLLSDYQSAQKKLHAEWLDKAIRITPVCGLARKGSR